ncbi:DinB family protein [Schlesneria paludicola]|uniref:DinB family protein n=1 Tax=Schlesneria paludicola TaxID=360056 RepID=UPI00029A816D|nr:DinB family protein [Schlesneria paludicola]
METIPLIARLNQHRAWTNRNLRAAVALLNDEQLHTSLPIGQGSVWKSLTHMYAAEYVWLGALHGEEEPLVQGDVRGKLPGNQLGEGKIADFVELRQKWEELELRWSEYVNGLQPSELEDTVFKVVSTAGAGVRFGTRRADILLHVCLHAHYTTAQTVNMLRQLGVEKLPESMLISLARHELAT